MKNRFPVMGEYYDKLTDALAISSGGGEGIGALHTEHDRVIISASYACERIRRVCHEKDHCNEPALSDASRSHADRRPVRARLRQGGSVYRINASGVPSFGTRWRELHESNIIAAWQGHEGRSPLDQGRLVARAYVQRHGGYVISFVSDRGQQQQQQLHDRELRQHIQCQSFFLNVRSGASTAYKVIGRIKKAPPCTWLRPTARGRRSASKTAIRAMWPCAISAEPPFEKYGKASRDGKPFFCVRGSPHGGRKTLARDGAGAV
jgi:hypothetical protein